MSAFVVSKQHIDALVRAGIRPRDHLFWYHPRPSREAPAAEWGKARHALGADTADEIGAMLWAENVKSVRHRYPNNDGNSMPGPISFTPGEADAYHLPSNARTFEPVAILKAISGYEYQTCEHPGWEDSQAHAFCEVLRDTMIRCLPGYEEATWEIS